MNGEPRNNLVVRVYTVPAMNETEFQTACSAPWK